ncbi:hypothetical protein HYC85_016265 [Camellia sinensis]|uniref:Helicase MOV-10-like beta-barrel domain-containing protein n=1 Tax=Camellia sinensis TaxID=4442 RepID=A0A7J7H0B2_CAMSI|nr:hypothetical protein HYC85_016265 [Camellia sinensis]
MSLIGRERCDDDFSVIGDKGEIGFLDFEDDKSLCAYDPNEEGPVLISIPFPFIRGKPLSVFVGETSAHPITIQNTTSEPVELWGVNFFCSNPADSFTLSLLKPPSVNSDADYIQDFLEGFSLEDRVLQPLQTQTIWLSCKPKDIGLHTSVVHFDVGDERIERVVFVLAEDKISRSLASKKPYSRFPRRKQFATNESAKTKTRGLDYKLPLFEIPTGVRELVENKQVPEKEMRCHDMERITMRRKGANLLALAVPGLAERRPSLVHGDFAFAMLAFQVPYTVAYIKSLGIFSRFQRHLARSQNTLHAPTRAAFTFCASPAPPPLSHAPARAICYYSPPPRASTRPHNRG